MANTAYDHDADEQHDIEHLRSAEQAHYDREFDDIANNFGDTTEHPLGDSESSAPIVGNELRGRADKAPKKADELKDDEAKTADDTVGKGYKNSKKDANKNAKFSASMQGKSKLKKRIAIAGAAAGGSFLGGLLIFLAMLPLKIEHVVNNLQDHFAAASETALDQETENLFDNYMVSKVMPNLGKGKCHSTIDATCVALTSSGNSPVSRLYNSWSTSRLENKMATKYNLQVGYKNGQYYINDGHSNLNLGDRNSAHSIFGDSNTRPSTRSEIRQAVRESLSQATLYDKMFTRFKMGALLESKYGIKRCLVACNTRDKFTDNINNKKLAAKGLLIQRVISPMSESYGIILQCIIGGGDTCSSVTPSDDSSVDNSGDQERTSKFQQNLQSQLDAFAEKFGQEALDNLLKDATDISDKGFTRYLVGKIATKLGVDVGEDKAIDSAIPVIGWINFAATTIGQLDNIGPKLKALNYAVASAGAVELYMSYRTVADEAKSGHMDATELGSFANTLSDDTQLDGKGMDMTSTPLYASLMGGGGTQSGKSQYKCNDGSSVPSGKLICDEENLSGGSSVANAVSNVENNIPGWGALTAIASAWNGTVGTLYNAVKGTLSDVTNWLFSHLPGMSTFQDAISSLISPLMSAITKFLIPSPFSDNMSGGRTFDMMAAGSDVAENKSCQVQLGCAQVSAQAMANIQNKQIAEKKAEFDSMPLFARMFNTSTPDSLISKLALAMPTNMLTATNDTTASILSNPFGKIGNIFSNLFTHNTAFAAQTAQPDPFGVPQMAYTNISTDPNFWDENCVNGPLATYDSSTQKLDVSKWLDQQKVDPNTGEAVATTPNQCLLMLSAVQSSGGLSDPSLLPSSSTSTASSTTPATPGTYQNPLRDIKNLYPERIDGGVDYNGDDGPIYAIGDGKVVGVRTSGSGWPGLGTDSSGAYILYQLSDGPAQGKFVYMAEDCTPTVKQGDTVTANTKICSYHYQGTAMEMGWGDGSYSYLTDDYNSHGGGSYASNSGQDFSNLLVALGSKPGRIEGTKSTVPMPAGWPTW